MPTTYNDPIMLDSTGQDIVDKLDSIASLMGDGVIDDTSTTATDKTWSASKENTVVNGLQSNVIANTKLIKDTVGWSGKNVWNLNNPDATYGGSTGVSKTILKKGYNVTRATAGEWIQLHIIVPSVFKSNTDYKLSTNITISSGGARFIVYGSTSRDGNFTTIKDSQNINEDGKKEIEFNTGNYTYFRIGLYCTTTTSTVGNVTYDDFMIRPADILDPTYEPYHKDVVDTLREAEAIKGKNIFNNKTHTVDGITFTVDKDGYATESNPSDSRSSLNYSQYNFFMPLKAGRYFVRVFQKTAKTSGYIGLHIADSSLNKYVTIGGDPDWSNVINNGLYFTIPSDMEVGILYKVGNGSYAFMITDDSETDHSYEPYYIPLKDSMFPRSEQAVLGAKNLFKNTGANETIATVVFTHNSNDSTGLSGTASATAFYTLGSLANLVGITENVKLTGCPEGGSTSNGISISVRTAGLKNVRYNNMDIVDTGDGFVFNPSAQLKDSDGNNVNLADLLLVVRIGESVVTTGKVLYPMIRLATDTDPTYAPYAMTNKELTDKATVKTIAHATAITEGDLSVTFTEYITGNVEQIVGVISSSVDKDIASQSGISIGTALAHKPLSSAEVIGSIDSSLSASDRRPICSIRISNTGRISIDGQMSANRNYTFTITYIFGS